MLVSYDFLGMPQLFCQFHEMSLERLSSCAHFYSLHLNALAAVLVSVGFPWVARPPCVFIMFIFNPSLVVLVSYDLFA